MYVLTLWGKPLAVADSFERLNEHMADPQFSATEQRCMVIFTDVPVLT